MGGGPARFVRADSLLPYTIHFENETNATAPAQRVVISDPLTNLLDWTTFELTEIAFGDHFIAVPPHTQHFEKTEKLSQNGFTFEVQIEAGIRLDTGEVYSRFQSLNPECGNAQRLADLTRTLELNMQVGGEFGAIGFVLLEFLNPRGSTHVKGGNNIVGLFVSKHFQE